MNKIFINDIEAVVSALSVLDYHLELSSNSEKLEYYNDELCHCLEELNRLPRSKFSSKELIPIFINILQLGRLQSKSCLSVLMIEIDKLTYNDVDDDINLPNLLYKIKSCDNYLKLSIDIILLYIKYHEKYNQGDVEAEDKILRSIIKSLINDLILKICSYIQQQECV